jgi:hypothetical protein
MYTAEDGFSRIYIQGRPGPNFAMLFDNIFVSDSIVLSSIHVYNEKRITALAERTFFGLENVRLLVNDATFYRYHDPLA